MSSIHTLIDYIAQSYSHRRLWTFFGLTWVFLILLGITGLYIGIGQTMADGKSIKLLDLMFNYSQEQAYLHLQAYGEVGRQYCLFSTLVLDSFYPLAYGPFLALILAHLLHKTKYRLFVVLPLLVMLADYLENTHIALMLINYPEQMPNIAYAGSLFTSTKWALVFFVFMAISFGFFLRNRKNFLDDIPFD